MKTESDAFPAAGGRIHASPRFAEYLRSGAIDPPDALIDRRRGTVVTDRRSSFVRRHTNELIDFYVKVYEYPTLRDRLRGAGRNTWLRPARASREHAALLWLRAHGFDAPEPLALGTWRTLFGFLKRAAIVTAAAPGEPLHELLPTLGEPDRRALIAALATLVERLHAKGFRHGNLDLRNLIGDRTDGGWRIAVIDAPRYRLRRPGSPTDRSAQNDRSRLDASLAAIDLPPLRQLALAD